MLDLIDRVRGLGPFCHLDRHGVAPGARDRIAGTAVFYADLAPGRRVLLHLPRSVPGLSGNALLVSRPDGDWDVFGDDGLLATLGEASVRVELSEASERLMDDGRLADALVQV